MTALPVIRPATEADRAALVEQFGALNSFEEPIARNRRTDAEGAVASLDAALARVAATGGIALVAEQDGQVLGHLVLTFETDGAYVREELRRHALVTDLFVREAARRRGVGTALLREAERIALAAGLRRLTVGVLAGNEAGAALYASFGFAPHAIELAKAIDGG